jgi:hypothetical protein
MADPSSAEILAQWKAWIHLLEETRKYGHVNASNFLDLMDTAEQLLEGDWGDDIEATGHALRAQLATMLSDATAASIQRPFLRQYCKSVVKRGNLANDQDMLDEIFEYFHDNSMAVQSRVFSFGLASAAGGNVGNGQILRLNKDKYDYDLENGHIDIKRIRCLLDQNTGTDVGNEVFQIMGETATRDAIKRSGSGLRTTLVGISADDSLLNNASFQSFSGEADDPDSIGSWTSSAGDGSSYYTFDSTNNFRAAPSDPTTSYAINLKATTNLTQKLTVPGVELSRNTPYLTAVVWNRAVGSGEGTLVVRMGSKSESIAISAQTGWVVSTVPGSLDQYCWYDNFKEDDLDIALEWTRTSGDLLIAEVLLVPGTYFDGSYYWALPGSAASYTAHLKKDEFTVTDTATDSIIQKWIARGFDRYLPHGSGSAITWTDP